MPRYQKIHSQRKQFSAKLKELIYKIYNGKCFDCNSAGHYDVGWSRTNRHNKKTFILGGLQIHHVKTIKDNGSNNIKNLVLLCPNCHIARHEISENIHANME